MALNKISGNMYQDMGLTHTWNIIKGECPHKCSYCYMHKWGKQAHLHFDWAELKTDLGTGNFIFVGSSCDVFANDIPDEWILKTLEHCRQFDNKYLFQSKNPFIMMGQVQDLMPRNSVFCVTFETNRYYPEFMGTAPSPIARYEAFSYMPSECDFITIEPIMKFDLKEFVEMIRECKPIQVNLGFDSGNNHLPEPSKEETILLIKELQKFTKVKIKSNAKRILGKNNE